MALVFLIFFQRYVPAFDFHGQYLWIHTTIEFLGIAVSFSVFSIGWATHRNNPSSTLLFLSLTSFAVGWFEFGHALSYNGMPEFITESNRDKAIHFWIASRITDSLAFLFVALFYHRNFNFTKLRWFGLCFTVFLTLLGFAMILFYPEALPQMYIVGLGLTKVKLALEWVAILVSAVAGLIFLFQAQRQVSEKIEKRATTNLACASFLFAMAGIYFTIYRDVDDLFNFLGHIYKMIAFLFLYRAILLECITKPFEDMRRSARSALIANEGKSRFLANVSHEFRTPLGVISGFTDLLMSSKSQDEEGRQWIETIKRNSNQLLFLIDDLLDLAKAETGRIVMQYAPFVVEELVEDVVSGLRLLAQKKKIILDFHLDPSAPRTMISDSRRFRQVLMNLIGNAIKFTPQGQVEVRVEGTPSGALKVLIRDTGIGIDASKLDRLFSPFSQVDDSYARQFGGTGLGLALSKKLAQLLGGDVWLEKSELGRGSVFAVTLMNQVASAENQARSKGPAVEGGSAEYPDLSMFKILVAEDAVDNQLLLKNYLAPTGVNLIFADNGLEALRAMEKNKFDLILMDIQMPELDGMGAMLEIKKSGWKGPVIALTAHAHQPERDRALQSGFDNYLVKPISRQDLIKALSSYLH